METNDSFARNPDPKSYLQGVEGLALGRVVADVSF